MADASAQVGLGHLMRCRALVEAIRGRLRRAGRGASVTFAGRYDRPQARRIRAWGYALAPGGNSGGRGRSGGSGGGAVQPRPNFVILDAYRPLGAELRAARASGARVVLFDDGHQPGRPQVDVRLIPNRAAAPPRAGSLDLMGPRYLCLRPEVARARGEGDRSGSTRVFVSLGGGRAPGLARLVGVLRGAGLPVGEWIVAGKGPATGSGRGRIQHVQEPTAVARAMAGSTVAVSAAGTTAWELACLGVPAVLLTRVANQIPIARALDRRAALWCRGRGVPRGTRSRSALAGTLPDVISALRRLLGDRALRERLSRGGRRLVDGRGAERAAAAILRRVARRSSSKRRSPPR